MIVRVRSKIGDSGRDVMKSIIILVLREQTDYLYLSGTQFGWPCMEHEAQYITVLRTAVKY